MARRRYAGLSGTIGSGNLTNSATTHTFTAPLVYGDAASPTTVPTLTGTDDFLLSILDASGNLSEVIKVTAYNSSTGAATTIVRGQEGTSGVSHASGNEVVLAAYASDFGAKDLLYRPASGQLTINEFNDGSLTGYTQVDKSGGSGRITWVEEGDSLYATTLGGDSASELHAQLIPLADFGGSLATNDAIITRTTYQTNPNATDHVMAGCVLSDGTATTGTKQVAAFGYQRGSWGVCEDFTNFQTGGTLSQSSGFGYWPSCWFRLVKTGTSTWRTDISSNGIHWITSVGTATQSFTPTHVGVFASSWGTSTVGFVGFDLLRRA